MYNESVTKKKYSKIVLPVLTKRKAAYIPNNVVYVD